VTDETISDRLDQQSEVLVWHMAGLLAYNLETREWIGGLEPLPDELQGAARQLVAAGLLPEFEGVVRS
jgi:hypothetical protein